MLVATDIVARGIDVEGISHVINYELPEDAENYVHRIGRTARAGRTGVAVSLCCVQDVSYLRGVERLLKKPLDRTWMTTSGIRPPSWPAWRLRPRRRGARPGRQGPGFGLQVGPLMSDSILGFGDLELAAPLVKAVAELGYESPLPIQAACIPPLLEGRDVLGLAQTGTGKTAAFALPLMSLIDSSIRAPQVLVLTPTRELALQVAEAFQKYARYMKGFHVLPIYGGQSYGFQFNQLHRGPHVIVGTPGRIQDHLDRKTLNLSNVKCVVLDEADEMLRMGFVDEVEAIISKAPEERQMALFSATMPAQIRRISKRYMKDPVEIKIEAKTNTAENIEQTYLVVPTPPSSRRWLASWRPNPMTGSSSSHEPGLARPNWLNGWPPVVSMSRR